MKITHLKTNHLTNPVGYDFMYPTISYIVEESSGKSQKSARVLAAADEAFESVIYDSGECSDIVNTGFRLPITLEPQTRYYWKVIVTDDTGETAESETAWFETARTVSWEKTEWQAKWITPSLPKEVQAVVWQDIEIEKPVKWARAYMVGLGVYEFYLNGEKQGDECLLPGFCDYDTWIQYQTYELSLKEGCNRFEIMLGDGWYKGNFGLRQRYENYGDRLAAIAQIEVLYEDGSRQTFATDPSWKARKSHVVSSGIYCGEVYDATADVSEVFGTEEISLGYDRLSPRLSPPLRIQEHIRPIEVIHSPKNETILDMGQNMVGWISFKCNAPAGTKIHIQTGEILQDGCFYNENLRTAKSEYTYISDGQPRTVREYFTFHGFRFVKVEGWNGKIDPDDFEGLVIHSEMEEHGWIDTSDPLVNQLVHNSKWGMKGNFLDVPTDCPQRDERYGWTGDAQIFSGTACFFMDTAAFYTKYGRDLYAEQKKLDGSVPDVVPVCNYSGDGSTAWGDAATIIPWNVYLHSGDSSILYRQYESMKGWVDYMKRQDDEDGAKRLWLSGTHYADWLALDGNYPGGVYGRTDPGYLASGYYYYSTNIVAKAAKIIGKDEDAAFYEGLAKEIYDAFVREYYTPAGNLSVDTTTGYVAALYFGLVPDFAYERVCRGLLNRLQKNYYHLDTGFIGTPYLCRVLTENGMNDVAYHLLMEKGYPGWLYEVLMGATTIWERWNSVMPDGKISGTEMNSLNHYSYGSIVEWMFRCMLGINPDEKGAGFKCFRISPAPNYQISRAYARLNSAAGLIESEWEIDGKELHFTFKVPFDAKAVIALPDADLGKLQERYPEIFTETSGCRQEGSKVIFNAECGTYKITYEPTTPYRKIYSMDSTWEELKANPKTREILEREYMLLDGHIPFEKERCTLEEMSWGPFTSMTREQRIRIDAMLREVE